ncbi:MAG: methyltransferase [Methylophaga sp.]|nr:MAG: methyltransferase [Methylophaga sp.]
MLTKHLAQFLALLFLSATAFHNVAASESAQLIQAVNNEHRTEVNRLRDQYRHPQQTLEFFGVQADMTVIEIWPGKGWYTAILAPFIKQGGGQFIAAGFLASTGPKWRQTMQREYQQWLANYPDYYDQVTIVEIGPPTFWQMGVDESVDAVLTFRNVHNWLKGGYETEMFNSFYRVLKPGGILGITDHRASPDTDLATMKQSGYLSQQLVVELARQAGFELEASSEINANPIDNKQHPKGVWTLPPTLRLGEQDKRRYLAIGESDRMTLRFRKPDKI